MIRRGFTLVEILIALLVLAIGLPSVIMMVLSCTRMTGATTYRNVAALVIAEAQDEIERLHCITNPDALHANDKGCYVETWDSTATTYPNAPLPPSNGAGESSWPNLITGYYKAPCTVPGGIAEKYPQNIAYRNDTNFPHCTFWPLSQDSKFYAGPQKRVLTDDTAVGAGLAFRVAYRLERHPDWTRQAYSPYAGVYVLTMTAYRDLNPKVLPSDAKKMLEQVADPVVVYLKRKN